MIASGLRLGLIPRPHPQLPRIGAVLAGQQPPAAVDWYSRTPLNGDALGNDVLGDCVPAAALRAVQAMRVQIGGDIRLPTRAQAEALYRDWAGWDGVPGSATDLGTASDTAAARWAKDGIWWGAWHDWPAVVGLDPRITSHLRDALAWLGPVQLDIHLPEACFAATDWQAPAAGDAFAGWHRICLLGYDEAWFYAASWGLLVRLSPAFVEACGADAMACVSRSWLDTQGRSPLGLDIDALEAQGRALAA